MMDSQYQRDSDLEEEDDNFDGDWSDESQQQTPAKSLFDDTTCKSAEEVLLNDKLIHGVDIVQIFQQLQFTDFYEPIKFINYVRKNRLSAKHVLEITKDSVGQLLDDETLMVPVIENDPLLQLDYEELASMQPIADNDIQAHQQSQRIVNELKNEVSSLRAAYDDLKELTRARFERDVADVPEASTSRVKATAESGNEDEGYFASYAENEIHEIMLNDRLRTETYQRFIEGADVFKDAIVLDVGCGTGILSMFAARRGAKHVYAVDASQVALKAKLNVAENGFADQITVIQGKIEDIKLPVEHVDIIISEWMGYFLLYESMLDSVLVARDRFLRPGGLVAPSQCSIMVSAMYDQDIERKRTFWQDVYGFKMTAMQEKLFEDADISFFPEDVVRSQVVSLKDVHVSAMKQESTHSFSSPFSLKITQDGHINGLLTWFDTFFTTDGRLVDGLTLQASRQLPGNGEVGFSTAPTKEEQKKTHWKQAAFVFKEPLAVKQGSVVSGTFNTRKNQNNQRELDVEVLYRIDGQAEVSQRWRVR